MSDCVPDLVSDLGSKSIANFKSNLVPNPVPNSATNFVEINNLNFSYGARAILSGLTMSFPRGKVIAIMGGSGSGKTTVLRLIGAQLTPQSGTVTLAGKLVHDLARNELYALRRNIGMLFQHGALFTDLSVFENVAFPLR